MGRRSRAKRAYAKALLHPTPGRAVVELHETGIPHEHGLLALAHNAPALSMRQEWWDLAGYARVDGIKNPEAVARYVAKYAGKKAAWPPCVWGFGVLREPSFSRVLT